MHEQEREKRMPMDAAFGGCIHSDVHIQNSLLQISPYPGEGTDLQCLTPSLPLGPAGSLTKLGKGLWGRESNGLTHLDQAKCKHRTELPVKVGLVAQEFPRHDEDAAFFPFRARLRGSKNLPTHLSAKPSSVNRLHRSSSAQDGLLSGSVRRHC